MLIGVGVQNIEALGGSSIGASGVGGSHYDLLDLANMGDSLVVQVESFLDHRRRNKGKPLGM